MLLEARLRDSIRGRSLFLEPLVSSTLRARRRGVHVTLLDDVVESTAGETVAHDVATWVAAIIDEAAFGTIVVQTRDVGALRVTTVIDPETGLNRALHLPRSGFGA